MTSDRVGDGVFCRCRSGLFQSRIALPLPLPLPLLTASDILFAGDGVFELLVFVLLLLLLLLFPHCLSAAACAFFYCLAASLACCFIVHFSCAIRRCCAFTLCTVRSALAPLPRSQLEIASGTGCP